MSMLEVENLVVSYGAIKALKGISFNVEKGEVITLIGSNGAGKTTTLHSISNLVKKASGTIKFEGKDITNMSADKIVQLGLIQVPKAEGLGKLSESDISLMVLSVFIIRKMARLVMALNTSCCTVHPDTDFTICVRYFGDRHSFSA